MSNYYFTEEHEMFRESLRAFLQKEAVPNIDKWEEDRRTPRDIWKKMGEQGFLGLSFPEKYGGANLDFFFDVVFLQEISSVYSEGFAITQQVTQYMVSPYILKFGSDYLKDKYMPGVVKGDLLGSIGITEPSAGSDVANIRTTAKLEGDHYIVNGSKTFITNAVYGDFIITVVKTDTSAGSKGFSLLVIDRNMEGVSATKLKKLGWHASDTAELAFDNVKVPKENLIGAEGKGFYYLMDGLQLERLTGGITCMASARTTMKYTKQYMSERQTFGKPINKHQVLRHRMAQMESELESCTQFVLHCCRLQNEKQYAVKECSMAKLLATELQMKIINQCLQMFGGYGFMEEYKIARMYRDCRISTIGAGSSEVMREIIAKMVIDDVSYSEAASKGSNQNKFGGYYFTEEHEMFRESLKAFLQKEVVPNLEEWEENRRTPRDIWKKMGDQGYLGLSYPKEYGGLELDFFYDVVFMEETSKVFSAGFSITQMVTQYMSSTYIAKHGSEFLKQKYLPGIISGDLISAIGITEPGAGSDAGNIQTKAILEGDHYIVNGSKTFITNGVYGDFIVTVVKTDPSKGTAGFSLLVIDRNMEGVSATKLKKLGWHSSDTAELAFEDVKVPKENLIGEEGKGFYYLMGGLQVERLTGAIGGYAACEASMEYTLQYMSERKAFGKPINQFQELRHRMAQFASEIESFKQFTLYCCRLQNEGEYAVKECSIAKLLGTELSNKIATECLQMFGGYGYMEEYKMARVFRDARIGTIGGGSSEIMREIIAKMTLDDVVYQEARTPKTASNGNATNGKEANNLKAILGSIQDKATKANTLGSTLKFDFGDEYLFIDGSGESNIVSAENKEAACKVETSFDDFLALTKGELNPMNAVMSGKLKIKGDMGIAMKLQSLFN